MPYYNLRHSNFINISQLSTSSSATSPDPLAPRGHQQQVYRRDKKTLSTCVQNYGVRIIASRR